MRWCAPGFTCFVFVLVGGCVYKPTPAEMKAEKLRLFRWFMTEVARDNPELGTKAGRIAAADHAELLELLKHMLEQKPEIAKSDMDSKFLSSRLKLAAGRGLTAVVELLLKHGADIEVEDYNGVRPLHAATGSVEMTELLLRNGADPNAKTKYGNSPLHSAVRGPIATAPATIRLLHQHGADLNARNSRGQTALQYGRSSEYAHLIRPAIRTLRELGAK